MRQSSSIGSIFGGSSARSTTNRPSGRSRQRRNHRGIVRPFAFRLYHCILWEGFTMASRAVLHFAAELTSALLQETCDGRLSDQRYSQTPVDLIEVSTNKWIIPCAVAQHNN
ncbi:MAG TPA: hypothetical protein VJY34_03845 [Roseiarcus sp.]|nr:hypothetical protein [Roseiarcus sp.]